MISVKQSKGFTIVELLLAVAISSIIVTVLLSLTLTYFSSAVRSQTTAQLQIESHYVLRSIIEDIRLADGIASTSAITDSSKPSGWTTSSTGNVIVIESPTVDSSHNVIYDPLTGYPYKNELIYYMTGNQLYKRTLKNTAASGNIAVTSCPPASSSSSCPADKHYTDYITDLSYTYYDTDDAVTTDPTLARSVKVGVTMARKSFGKTVTYNDSIQATLRNY